jgi:hypothetical protein
MLDLAFIDFSQFAGIDFSARQLGKPRLLGARAFPSAPPGSDVFEQGHFLSSRPRYSAQ